jgi:RNA recognition motif-containing protein
MASTIEEKMVNTEGVKLGEGGFTGTSSFEDPEEEHLEGPPRDRFRPGGPKEARLNRVRLMETGRYYEASIARGETPEDPDAFFSLRVDNLPVMTTEDQLRAVFSSFGQLGDVYRPIDKDTKKPLRFVFVRFIYKQHMLNAMHQLNGQNVNGRPMRIVMAKPGRYELDTSIY